MIVFALRHADRTDGDDLSPAGETRAKLLAQLLGGSGVATAFVSKFNRAKKTAQPLKDALGTRLTIKPATEVQEIVAGVKALPEDAVAVIVGHSDTVPESIKALTGKVVRIEDNEFDKLFVLLISGEESSVALGRYGKPT
jgi:2,3-bisphosphoglycerate-dependent phosphoglycerate mutase